MITQTTRADALWKGRRADDLERCVVDAVVRNTKRAPRAVFNVLDETCEAIAADRPRRLARSIMPSK